MYMMTVLWSVSLVYEEVKFGCGESEAKQSEGRTLKEVIVLLEDCIGLYTLPDAIDRRMITGTACLLCRQVLCTRWHCSCIEVIQRSNLHTACYNGFCNHG